VESLTCFENTFLKWKGNCSQVWHLSKPHSCSGKRIGPKCHIFQNHIPVVDSWLFPSIDIFQKLYRKVIVPKCDNLSKPCLYGNLILPKFDMFQKHVPAKNAKEIGLGWWLFLLQNITPLLVSCLQNLVEERRERGP
jgi:hypothetical protein